MFTLSALRPLRLKLEYPRPLLSTVALIAPHRLRDIEVRKVEPWFDEALRIARALGQTIPDLIASGDLTTFERDPALFPRDLDYWRSGVRLPLTVALRLAYRFGIEVDALDPSPLARQVWSVVQATERHPEASGWCPWCAADIVGGEPHADHCLPHHLYGERAAEGIIETYIPEHLPRPAKAGRRNGGATAYGLRSIREEQGKTQVEMAKLMSINPNHYARVERGELPLVLDRATALADALGIDRDRVYTAPAQ